ncbi:MAG TPA: transporter substrate-binding domain-containing protein [Methanospirillum sp.]|uniref:transporter substrate-binding domain-containing protein n=1 Tax=Methanospirillum sp. TaxID=45200 RepID=UPI002C5219D2|nr:transporter substrate-binding domain-containing protein [Methanospirillum sp.]HWQ63584.1 transporter substrate-binding domain-containing protein [Methanospirillum sp.]
MMTYTNAKIPAFIILVFMLIPAVSLAAPVPAFHIDDLKVVTEDYAPLNYLDNGTLKGISVDLTEAALHQLGSNITRESFSVLPWSEAYNLARTTPDTILFSADRLPEREDLFLWAGPVMENSQVLFTRTDTNQSDIGLGSQKIVVLTDDCGKAYALTAGADEKNIIQVPQAKDAVMMIENGSADGWAYDELAGQHAIMKYAADPGQIGERQVLGTSRYYLAFNPETPTEFVHAINNTLQDFKRNRTEAGVTRYERTIADYLQVRCTENSTTREQVTDLVNTTSAALAADAPDTIKSINAGKNPYRSPTDPDLYVFVFDTSVNLLANAVNSANIGKNLAGTTDVFGYPFRDEIVKGAEQNGTGWVSYIYSNPDSLGLYQKMSYYQMVKGSDGNQYVVGVGRYQTCDEKAAGAERSEK